MTIAIKAEAKFRSNAHPRTVPRKCPLYTFAVLLAFTLAPV
jgi:hypothetical protein